MKRFFSGLERRSHNQEDEDLYSVQSRPRTPQTSRGQEYYPARLPRLQTWFDVLPYDYSPEGSPETRHSRTDTGNDTASLHKDRPFYDQARNVRGKSIPEEINRSAVRQMKQNYEEEIRNFQIAKQNQSKRLEDIKQQYEGKMRSLQDKVYRLQLEKFDMRSQLVNVKKEPEHMKYLNLQLTESRKSPEQKVDDYSTQLQPCCYRLQQYKSDYMSAIEEIERLRKQSEDTTTKLGEEMNKHAHIQADVTQLKDAHDRAQQNNIDLKAVIKQLENDNHHLTRQMDQNRLQTEKLQKENSQQKRNDNQTLQNKLHDTERTLKETKSKLQETKKSLQQYQKDLKSALEQKQQETHIKTQLQTELKQLEKKECMNALITKLENSNQQLSRQMEQNRLQKEQLQKEGAKRMRNDITTLQNKLSHSEQALKDTKTRMQETELRFEQLQEERQSLEKQNVDHNIQNDRMRIEINYLQEALDTQQKSKHLLLQQYQVEIRSLQEENTRTQKSHDSQWSKESDALKTENGKLHAEKYRLNAENNRLQNQVAELRHEHCQLQADNDQLKKQMNDYTALQNKLVTTEQELNTTKLVLKETKAKSNTCLGDQETKDSPNIVELSDMNRPSKLAERYKDLYDNQWTDAYEILEESVETEEQIISILLNILVETKRFCDHQTEMEMDHVLRVVTRKDSMQQSDVPLGVINYIKGCRKSTVAETMKVKYKEYVDELRNSPLSFVKHALRVDAYLLECFEVCWLMAIQDPPVVLAPVLKSGEAFKTDLYSPYTVCGKIVDYVVWPALLLHTNGPTLTKGVAQGMKKC